VNEQRCPACGGLIFGLAAYCRVCGYRLVAPAGQRTGAPAEPEAAPPLLSPAAAPPRRRPNALALLGLLVAGTLLFLLGFALGASTGGRAAPPVVARPAGSTPAPIITAPPTFTPPASLSSPLGAPGRVLATPSPASGLLPTATITGPLPPPPAATPPLATLTPASRPGASPVATPSPAPAGSGTLLPAGVVGSKERPWPRGVEGVWKAATGETLAVLVLDAFDDATSLVTGIQPATFHRFTLVRLRVTYLARGQGPASDPIGRGDFQLLSSAGTIYDPPVGGLFDGELSGVLVPGGSLQGGVIFELPKTEAPVAVGFRRGVAEVAMQWFAVK
jgi:hypothetical protein